MNKNLQLVFRVTTVAVVLSGCSHDSMDSQKEAAQRLLTKDRNQATITHIDTVTIQSVCGKTRDFGEKNERGFYVDLVNGKVAIDGDKKFTKLDYENVCARSLAATRGQNPAGQIDDAERRRLIEEFGIVSAADATAKGLTASEYRQLKETAAIKDSIERAQAESSR